MFCEDDNDSPVPDRFVTTLTTTVWKIISAVIVFIDWCWQELWWLTGTDKCTWGL